MGSTPTSRRIQLFSWVLLIFTLVHAALPPPARAQTIQWIRQFGSTATDYAFGVAVDATGVYVVGITFGTLPGQTSAGGADAFVRRYDANGAEQWTRQSGTASGDETRGVAVDATGVYIAGSTLGTLPGQSSAGGQDAFVRRYDANGNALWTRQFGSSGPDVAYGVAVDATGVYIVGSTGGTLPGQTSAGDLDAFVRKYDVNGNALWTRQFGSASGIPGTRQDEAYGVAVDTTGVYVVGYITATLPEDRPTDTSANAFVRKYDANGNVLWARQFGSASLGYDAANGVAVDATGIYVGGVTDSALPGQTSAGLRDTFVRKYDANGNEVWTRQFGTRSDDGVRGVAVDATGVYLLGGAGGALPGQTASGVFVRKYDGNGTELWTLQFDWPGTDGGAVAVGTTGVYVGGYTRGTLPGQTSAGEDDAFVVKMTAIPLPPAVSEGGVVNNASFAPSPAPVAPGSIAAVFGTNLNNGSAVLFSSFGPDGKLVTSLGGASVTINNVPAPMFYSTPGQLGVQIPFEVAGQTSATIQVTVGGHASPSRTIVLDALAPGIFTLSQDGRGAAAVLHQDGVTPVTVQNPARPNEVVVFFATGLGTVTPPLATGAPSTGNRTVATPTVTIDGIPTTVEFSGAAPGFVGLNQINVRIPASTRSATNIPVVLSIGGKPSNAVTIAVGP